MMMKVFLVGFLVFILNIPFGYWRANVHKFSWLWIYAIHIPVPIIITLRIITHIGFGWVTYAVLITSFFIGQKMGGVFHDYLKSKHLKVTSCLVMDLLNAQKSGAEQNIK